MPRVPCHAGPAAAPAETLIGKRDRRSAFNELPCCNSNWLALFTEILLMRCLSQGEPTTGQGRAGRPARGKRQGSKGRGKEAHLCWATGPSSFFHAIAHIARDPRGTGGVCRGGNMPEPHRASGPGCSDRPAPEGPAARRRQARPEPSRLGGGASVRGREGGHAHPALQKRLDFMRFARHGSCPGPALPLTPLLQRSHTPLPGGGRFPLDQGSLSHPQGLPSLRPGGLEL